jgi:hypothetical protein
MPRPERPTSAPWPQAQAGRTPRPGIDEQILATWRALRANPDLDARHAMQAIDQLLDKRTRLAGDNPPEPTGPPTTLEPGSPAQHAVLASVLGAVMLESDALRSGL